MDSTKAINNSSTPSDKEEDDEDSVIDEEQIQEYREDIEKLGSFPDKVQINSLSMVAEDHADSKGRAKAVYREIRNRLLSTSSNNLLPLVYLVDSILKNAKGNYVEIIEADAGTWIPLVYRQLQDPQKQKLEKVWKTWNDAKIFAPDALKAMGRCFEERAVAGKLPASLNTAVIAGIARTSDGRLVLSAPLRRAMEDILDEMQSEMDNELDKVSLERLADLNPDLLATIKKTAGDALRTRDRESSRNGSSSSSSSQALPSYYIETRPPSVIRQSKAWSEHKWDFPQDADIVINKIKELVDQGSLGDKLYTQQDALDMTQILAGGLATAAVLEAALERIQRQTMLQKENDSLLLQNFGLDRVQRRPGGLSIDKSLFTNNGIKEKNYSVIGMLYEVGLPFVSSVDGRRFATQLELSKHLDVLFKRNQLEKSIARTEERGWYDGDVVWTREKKEEDMAAMSAEPSMEVAGESLDDGYDSKTSTMPADENRSFCVVCGINFKMVFDNDDGIYKYSNCREIEMLNDDAAEAESEQVLLHVTCWRGLGSPEVLTADQALHDVIHR